jgi:hypothetical protein
VLMLTYRVFGYAKVWMERLGLKIVRETRE